MFILLLFWYSVNITQIGETNYVDFDDSYWGWGPDKQEQNKLGLTLMQVRSELR